MHCGVLILAIKNTRPKRVVVWLLKLENAQPYKYLSIGKDNFLGLYFYPFCIEAVSLAFMHILKWPHKHGKLVKVKKTLT